MKSSVTRTFRQQLEELPVAVQEQAERTYALWSSDPYHNSLQFKRVNQRQPIDSARVSLNYRVLGLLVTLNSDFWGTKNILYGLALDTKGRDLIDRFIGSFTT